jgi:hypothetical protein
MLDAESGQYSEQKHMQNGVAPLGVEKDDRNGVADATNGAQ